MGQQWDVVAKAADVVAARCGRAPVGVVLGTGLSECLDNLDHPQVMEFSDIPGMPIPTSVSHRGALIYGAHGDVPVLALCGRTHMYEDRTPHEVAMGIRLLSLLGVHSLIVTSAVSSVDPELLPGTIMLVEDHVNLSGTSVLSGEHDDRFGPRFPNMNQAYDPDVASILEEVGQLGGVSLERGVLAQFHGPAYETPAEVRFAQTVGARVVSMSMVPDVDVAQQRGMRVAGLACVTNMGAGLRRGSPPPEEVLSSNVIHASTIQTLLSGAVTRLAVLPEHRQNKA